MQRESSPIPQALRWIPTVINYLDNIEDFLIVTLTIAKPILKRLPLRFIPYIGWLLFIDDVLNLTNLMLGTALGGRSFKRATLKSVAKMVTRRPRAIQRVADFMGPTAMLPFWLQAGQVLESITGYGLALGGIMGLVTDSFWSVIRSIEGNHIVIKGNNDLDILGKAASIMVQNQQMPWMYDILTPKEHKNAMLAHNIAAQIVAENFTAEMLTSRLNLGGELSYPLWEPWNPVTIEVINENKIPFSGDPENGSLPYLPVQYAYPTYSDVFNMSAAAVDNFEYQMQNVFGRHNTDGMIANMAWLESTENLLEKIHGVGWSKPIYSGMEIDAYHAIEYGIFPSYQIDDETFLNWMRAARDRSAQKGKSHATFEDLRDTCIELIHTFQRGPFQTFPNA